MGIWSIPEKIGYSDIESGMLPIKKSILLYFEYWNHLNAWLDSPGS